MAEKFRLLFSEREKDYLRGLVPWSISQGLNAKSAKWPPEPPTEQVQKHLGAFVTLTLEGRLRGCIGNIVGNGPLYLTIVAMARAAAFQDLRFSPLQMEEFARLEWEISVLGPLEPCPDPDKVEIGRHGLMIQKGSFSGLLLPQVPVEWHWDRTTFLKQVCRKAGLPDQAWTDPASRLYWFEAEIF